MPVKTLFEGARYEVCAWLDEEERCQLERFILALYAKNDPDAEAMVNLLDRTASHGPPPNEQKFRYLRGIGQGLVEFKARGGSRVLGFIDTDRRRIVCTHGIPKLKEKRFNREMERAQGIRDTYLIETTPEESGYVN